MSKILILTNLDGGLYKFRKELVQELLVQGNEVVIALPYGELVDKLIEMGCTFIETPLSRRGTNPFEDLKLILQYRSIIKRVKPDKVLTYTIKPNIYGGIACRFMKVPYFCNITGLGTAFQGNGKIVATKLYKFALKFVKRVFFQNQENMRIFLENNIIEESKCVSINGSGVNLEEFFPSEYPKEKNDIRFLFIGRVMREKGVNELFEAAHDIKKKYPNVVFDVVGPYEDNYQDKVNKLVNKNVVVYHGHQSDVRPFIEKSNCVVLPSYHEGMSNTLLEAAAMSRPLIASNISGCKEAIIDGENGFLIQAKDANDLYRAIYRFIELPYSLKVEMGIAGREHIEKTFDKRKIVRKILSEIS
jgi:galacturonosyltransferase